jgi:molybdopterin converting factor subunit 1
MDLPDERVATPRRTLTVRCRFFARYAELLGCERHTLELPEGATVADVVAAVRQRLDGGAALPERPLVAINREHVLPGQTVNDGDEVALLPPLAGG